MQLDFLLVRPRAGGGGGARRAAPRGLTTLREGMADGGGQGGAEGGIVDELRVLETALVDVPRFFVPGAPLSDHYGIASEFLVVCNDA